MTAHVRVFGVALDEQQQAYIRRKLGMKLGKYGSAIKRISVRVSDVNGPRNGVDRRCRVKVVLSALPSIVVERQDGQLRVAIDSAVRTTTETVRRVLGRRRMKPLHRRLAGGDTADPMPSIARLR